MRLGGCCQQMELRGGEREDLAQLGPRMLLALVQVSPPARAAAHSATPHAVDIAVPSRQLAIEVDGPTHFCRNVTQGGGQAGPAGQAAQPRPLGGTLLKRRLIEGQGWRVASVNVAQWETLRGAEAKRRALQAAIAAAQGQA